MKLINPYAHHPLVRLGVIPIRSLRPDRVTIVAPWEPDMSRTCPGCGCKSVVEGTCTKCGAVKGGAR